MSHKLKAYFPVSKITRPTRCWGFRITNWYPIEPNSWSLKCHQAHFTNWRFLQIVLKVCRSDLFLLKFLPRYATHFPLCKWSGFNFVHKIRASGLLIPHDARWTQIFKLLFTLKVCLQHQQASDDDVSSKSLFSFYKNFRECTKKPKWRKSSLGWKQLKCVALVLITITQPPDNSSTYSHKTRDRDHVRSIE